MQLVILMQGFSNEPNKQWNFDFMENFNEDQSYKSHTSPRNNYLRKEKNTSYGSFRNSWNILKDTIEEIPKSDKIPFQRVSIFSNPWNSSQRNSICYNLNEDIFKDEVLDNQGWKLNNEEQENFNQILKKPEDGSPANK